MCRSNCSIVEAENKEERKINSRLTYEDRIKIEEKLRSRKKITITQIAEELGRDKSIISREIKRNSYLKWDERTAKYKKYIQQEEHKEIMKIEEKMQEESQR